MAGIDCLNGNETDSNDAGISILLACFSVFIDKNLIIIMNSCKVAHYQKIISAAIIFNFSRGYFGLIGVKRKGFVR
jgi:hypothetical protein